MTPASISKTIQATRMKLACCVKHAELRVAKGFCVTRDGPKISSVTRDGAKISRVMRDRTSQRDL